MSNYTTQVRFIVEQANGLTESSGGSNVNTLIANALDKIFDFDFPIFDEAYRPVLETKILKHFYTREIGLETVGLWKLKLDTKLNEIMPYYNQLYKSELLEFNPFYDVDITRTREGQNEGTRTDVGSGTTTANGSVKNTFSDTPQGALTGLEDGTYMSSASINTANDSSTNTSSVTSTLANTDEYIETVKGKQGVKDYSSLLISFRATFMNIDMQIIDELEELFMGVW